MVFEFISLVNMRVLLKLAILSLADQSEAMFSLAALARDQYQERYMRVHPGNGEQTRDSSPPMTGLPKILRRLVKGNNKVIPG